MNDLAERIKNIKQSNDFRRVDLEGPVLVAHQPQFLPWLGFVSKAAMGDIYLIHDIDQFKKETFENRNRIRVHQDPGWEWVTIPVKDKNSIKMMQEVEIIQGNWKKKYSKTFKYSYSQSPYFGNYYEDIMKLLWKDEIFLHLFNKEIIKYAFKQFNINVPLFYSSDLVKNGFDIDGKGTDFLIKICKVFNAKTFIAGQMGKEYIDFDRFKYEGIQLIFQVFNHPQYTQIHGEFIPYMSFIDLLFNHGDDSIDILGKSDYELAK